MPKLFNILLIVFCLAQAGSSQTEVSIIGFVFSSDGSPLEGVNIAVSGSGLGGATNPDGHFEIRGLKYGEYRLTFRHIGFATGSAVVTVKPGVASRLRIALNPAVIRFPDIEVKAERSEFSLQSFAPDIRIIERENIESQGARNIAEILASVPGVFVKSYGNASAQQTVSIRGSEGNQVVVLVDGEQITNAQSGSANLSAVSVAAIERIEVMTGSASSVLGSGAIGGVINIITKSFEERGFAFSHYLGGGSFGSRQAGGEFSANHGRFALAGAGSWNSSTGDFEFTNTARVSRPQQHRDNADFDAYNAFLKTRFLLSNNAFIEAAEQFYSLETGVPGEIGNPTPNARFDERRYLTNATLVTSPGPGSTLSLSGRYHAFRNGFLNRALEVPKSANRNDRIGIEARYQLRLRAWDLTVGAGFLHDTVAGSSIDGERRRRNFGLFATGRRTIGGHLSFFPSLRMDFYSGGERQLSPKIGLLYKSLLTKSIALHASAGRAFRVPDFSSLFFVSGVQVKSNPSLQPERAVDFDIGLDCALPLPAMKSELSATIYHRKTEGTILWLPDFRFTWSPRNIGSVVSHGGEFSWSFSDRNDKHFRATLNYTLAHTRFDLSGNTNPVPYRPEHVLSGELLLHIGVFDLNLAQRYVGPRYPNVAGTNILNDYWISDIALSSAIDLLGTVIKPKVSINNVFSREYQVVANFPMPGREIHLRLGVEY